MLHIGSGNNIGLGEYTALTAIAKQTDCIVDMPPAGAKYAILFNELAPVQITENPAFTPVADNSDDLWIKDKMRYLNKEYSLSLNPDDCVSVIHPTKDAIKWAEEIYADVNYAVKINCSNFHKLTRECHPQKWERLIEDLSAPDVNIVQFGTTDNYTKIDNIHIQHARDLSLDKLIGAYSVIGRYIGVDTGDWHVAFAVGCKCLVFHPGECSKYKFHRWNYEHENIRFINFNEMEIVDAGYVSNFFG